MIEEVGRDGCGRVSEEERGEDDGEERVAARDGGWLPAIHKIRGPEGLLTQSARLRWYYSLGYPVSEIARFLGVRYQQVRNICLTIPKRGAREELPPPRVELLPQEDLVDVLLGMELERGHREALRRRPLVEDMDDERYGLPIDEP